MYIYKNPQKFDFIRERLKEVIERNMNENKFKILKDSMKIMEKLQEKGFYMFCHSEKCGDERAVVGAIILMACRLNKIPISSDDICFFVSDENVSFRYLIHRKLKEIKKVLEKDTSLVTNLRLLDAVPFIEEKSKKNDIHPLITNKAKEIYKFYSSKKNPTFNNQYIAGACLYIASQYFEEKLTQKQVSDFSYCTDVTIRKIVKDIKKYVKSIEREIL